MASSYTPLGRVDSSMDVVPCVAPLHAAVRIRAARTTMLGTFLAKLFVDLSQPLPCRCERFVNNFEIDRRASDLARPALAFSNPITSRSPAASARRLRVVRLGTWVPLSRRENWSP